MTLVEVLIGVVVLSIATLGVMGSLTYGVVSNEYAGTYSEANQMAREIVEGVRAEQIAFVEDDEPALYNSVFDPTKKPIESAPFDGSYLTLPDLRVGDRVQRFDRVVRVTELDDQLSQIEATVYWEMKNVEKSVTVVALSRDYLGGTGTTAGGGTTTGGTTGGGSTSGTTTGGSTSGTTTGGSTSGTTTGGGTDTGTTTGGGNGNGNGGGNGNGNGGKK